MKMDEVEFRNWLIHFDVLPWASPGGQFFL